MMTSSAAPRLGRRTQNGDVKKPRHGLGRRARNDDVKGAGRVRGMMTFSAAKRTGGKVKGLAKGHRCMTYRHRQRGADGHREGDVGSLVEVGQGVAGGKKTDSK